jgi:putative transport protein
MSWIFQVHETQPVAHAIGTPAYACVLGVAAGGELLPTVFGTAGMKFPTTGLLAAVLPLLSDAPTVAYTTVYPLTTLLRILSAQILANVLFL